MNVETITMSPEAAVAKLEAWRHRLKRNPDPEARKEYEGAMAGYKALAKGTAVIDLTKVMAACPRDEHHRPTLAVTRADAKTVGLQVTSDGCAIFAANGRRWVRSNARWGSILEFKVAPVVGILLLQQWRAIVPMIPLDVGPERIDLARHAILWEANWKKEPPTDPMLLRPLAGSLYAVVAAWDLTPLERAVISGRLR